MLLNLNQHLYFSFLPAGFGGFGGFPGGFSGRFPGGFPGAAGGPFGSGDLSSLGNMPQTVRNPTVDRTVYSLQNVSTELKILF